MLCTVRHFWDSREGIGLTIYLAYSGKSAQNLVDRLGRDPMTVRAVAVTRTGKTIRDTWWGRRNAA